MAVHGLVGVFAYPAAPPPSCVWDDTRALPPATEEQISTAILSFQKSTGCDFWLAAVTSVDAGATLRESSRKLRWDWSPHRPAFLLLHSRGKDASSISVSPEIWNRYPASDLIGILQTAGARLGQKSLPLEERLLDTVITITQEIERLESIRQRQATGPSALEQQAAITFALIVTGVTCVGGLLGWRARTRRKLKSTVCHFPQAAVASRLGALFGGGVIAETHPPGG